MFVCSSWLAWILCHVCWLCLGLVSLRGLGSNITLGVDLLRGGHSVGIVVVAGSLVGRIVLGDLAVLIGGLDDGGAAAANMSVRGGGKSTGLGGDELIVVVTALRAVVIAVASTAAMTSTSAAATAAMVLEAVLAVLVSTLLPIIGISVAATVVEASTSPTAATVIVAALEFALVEGRTRVARLHLAPLDHLGLLFDICLLGHDLQIVLFPLGGGVQGKERLGGLLVGKLDEDGALEELIVGSAEAHAVDGSVTAEESLEIELGRRLLVSKALSIDTGSHSSLGSIADRDVSLLALDRLLALCAFDVEKLALLERGDNRRVGLEDGHALEGADLLEGYRLVLGATGKVP